MVSEPMVVCGESGEVFMIHTQWGQRKPKRPTHKDPREEKKKKKPNKEILLMVQIMVWCEIPMDIDVRGSYGCAYGVDTRFPWMAYVRPMDDALMKLKVH